MNDLLEHINGIDDVRDLLYIFLAIPVLILLVWRSVSANRQANAALDHVKSLQEQVALTQRDSLNQRFQSASDMLGSEVLSTRIGAVYSLMRLAEDRPEEFHIQTMILLCAFLRNPPSYASESERVAFRDDVHTILQALKRRSKYAINLEKDQKFYMDLTGVRLVGAALRHSQFSRAQFTGADLSEAYSEGTNYSHSHWEHCNLRKGRFVGANFFLAGMFSCDVSSADLQGANLHRSHFHRSTMCGTNLKYARMTGASLSATNLTGACLYLCDLSGARIESSKLHRDGTVDEIETFCTITQAQLDEATADTENPPKIAPGTIDIETGQDVAWNMSKSEENWEKLTALKQQGADRDNRDTT